MNENLTFLLIGIGFGVIPGVILTIVYYKVSGFLIGSEASEYRDETRRLKKRIKAKDKQIGEMMNQAEKIAVQVSNQQKGGNE